eukprot:CAMPEP_0117611508 /NCGR_PEP_ID=MMETSP0784-20121206/82431_1 /TAXON_ID=39447 /ORGANISM="" /LENGTH=123 /DNA_ID=CAMNT_0005414957 /DNA_START=60 /DNA_END=427 /DNA_ORIENTATION=+
MAAALIAAGLLQSPAASQGFRSSVQAHGEAHWTSRRLSASAAGRGVASARVADISRPLWSCGVRRDRVRCLAAEPFGPGAAAVASASEHTFSRGVLDAQVLVSWDELNPFSKLLLIFFMSTFA